MKGEERAGGLTTVLRLPRLTCGNHRHSIHGYDLREWIQKRSEDG